MALTKKEHASNSLSWKLIKKIAVLNPLVTYPIKSTFSTFIWIIS
jgi:hypothetical protein